MEFENVVAVDNAYAKIARVVEFVLVCGFFDEGNWVRHRLLCTDLCHSGLHNTGFLVERVAWQIISRGCRPNRVVKGKSYGLGVVSLLNVFNAGDSVH